MTPFITKEKEMTKQMFSKWFNENMSSLTLMSIENSVLQSMNWNDIIKQFAAAQKVRRTL